MKRIFVLALLVCACACGLHAQLWIQLFARLSKIRSRSMARCPHQGHLVAGFDQFSVKTAAMRVPGG